MDNHKYECEGRVERVLSRLVTLAMFCGIVTSTVAVSACRPKDDVREAKADSALQGDVAQDTLSLDVLMARLVTSEGEYRPETNHEPLFFSDDIDAELFRPHGRRALERLVECFDDTTTTRVYHTEDETQSGYPVGAICYELVTLLIRPNQFAPAQDSLWLPRGDPTADFALVKPHWLRIVKDSLFDYRP